MNPFLMILAPGIFALSAFVAIQGLLEIRQREAARARAMGVQAGRGRLADIFRELRRSQARLIETLMPQGLRDALQSKIDKADLKSDSGLLAYDMLAYGAGAAMIGLFLDMGTYTALAALTGLTLPYLRVNDLGLRRQLSMRRDLPDALDLLCACVEAGLGFDQALARVAGRMKMGALRKELEACVNNLSVGASRREALRELDRKAGLEELSQVLSALLQADKRGVPLGPALRAQSGQLRILRSLRVKKAAAEAPLKMLFPLMAFILPVVFIVLFGPIILKWQAGGL